MSSASSKPGVKAPIDSKKLDKIRSLVNLLRKSFECSICIDYYTDPVITNCQHSFCRSCIESYIGNKRSQNCPLCKAPINLRSLKNYDLLNDYVRLSKDLTNSFEADQSDSQKLDPESIKAKFHEILYKLNTLPESSEEKTSSEEPNPNIIQATNKEMTPTTPLQKRKRSVSGEQNMSSKKAKQNLQRNDAAATTSGLREIAVNKMPLAASSTNRLVETPALRSGVNQERGSNRLQVAEQPSTKSSISITKLTRSSDAADALKDVNQLTAFESDLANACRSPRTIRRDERNKENLVPPKTPVTPSRKPHDQDQSANKNENPLKFKKENSEILNEPNFTNKARLNFDKTETRSDKASKESPGTRKSPRQSPAIAKTVEVPAADLEPLPFPPPDPVEFVCADNEAPNVVNETSFPDLEIVAVQNIEQPPEQIEKPQNEIPQVIECTAVAVEENASTAVESPEKRVREKVSIRFIQLGKLAVKDLLKEKEKGAQPPVAKKELKDASTQTESQEQPVSGELFTELNRSLLEREIFETVFSELEVKLIEQIMQERQEMINSYLSRPSNDDAHEPEPESSSVLSGSNLYVPISTMTTMTTMEPTETSHVNESVCEPTVLLTNSSANASKSNAAFEMETRIKTSKSSTEAKANSSSRQFIDLLNTSNFTKTSMPSLNLAKPSKARFSLSTSKKRLIPSLEFVDSNKTYAGSQLDESFAPSSYRPKTSKQTTSNLANQSMVNETVIDNFGATSNISNVQKPRVSLNASVNISIAAGNLNSSIVYQHGQKINDSICEDKGSPERSKGNESVHQSLLIITETPVKGSDDGGVDYEHDESLSKTATRVEFALGTSLNDTSIDENRTMRNKTLDTTTAAEPLAPSSERTSISNETTRDSAETSTKSKTIVNETLMPDEDLHVQNEPESSASKDNQTILEPPASEFSKPLPATTINSRRAQESFMMNSFNVTNTLDHDSPPLLPTLASSSSLSDGPKAKNAKLAVPNAQDILGTSFAQSETTFSSSGENPRKSAGSKSSDESGLADKTIPVNTNPVVTMAQADITTISEQPTFVYSLSDNDTTQNQSRILNANRNQHEVMIEGKLVQIKQEKGLSPVPEVRTLQPGQRLEFVCSLLKSEMKANVKRLAELLKATVANEVTDSTTHLIVESDARFLCGVTSKYLKAISRKIWLVSAKWVIECLKQKGFIDPLPYEIKGDGIFGEHMGPHRSRTSGPDSGLFTGYEFLFTGKFEEDSINLTEMIELARKNGATVVTKAKEFSEVKIRVVIFDEKAPRLSVKNANMMYETAKIHSLMVSWFLDSIACYKVKEFELYALYKLSN